MADPASAPEDGSTTRPRLLLIDDDQGILSTLGPFLQRSGFDVSTAADGVAGLAEFRTGGADVVVLDVSMPGLDGREVLRRLRAGGSWTPVLMLTQLGSAGERAMTLDEGADDYLNKPFDPVELVARVRAVLRRASAGRPLSARGQVLAAGQLQVDRAAHRAFLAGRELTLTPRAMVLLGYLVSHPRELHTRQHLLEVLWGYEHPVGTRAVDNRIAELRRALGDDAAEPVFIETVPNRGYRFVAAVTSR